MGARPVRGERTAEIVARRLSQAILDGDLMPGTRLREETLAAAYGVSRTPIREALILLSSSGLIELAPNRGATVLQLGTGDITEIYHLRGVLEAEAVSLAGRRITPELIALLGRACDRLAGLHGATAADQLAADMQFHYGIAEAAGSPRLFALIRQVCAIPEGYRSSIPYGGEDLTEAERQHRAIARALRQGPGPEAAELMRDHVAWAGQLAVRSLSARLAAPGPSIRAAGRDSGRGGGHPSGPAG
jgi:DNA-binding GntR family transcriptional regulator